ncbi:MAG TPA: type II toxin-antitoxin system Phd/YefM family antitoxin [Gammaproteobacteria bacterium]
MPARKHPTIVNVHEAKTHFSKLLARVARGQEVVVAKSGKPVARLVPMNAPARRRPAGWDGVKIPDSAFFEPLPEDELQFWESGRAGE